MIKVSKFIAPERIFFLSAQTREEVLQLMVEQLHATDQILDKEQFFQAILDRERIVSTGIGMGVAIPHAKLAAYRNFFISIAILQKGVNWNALDDVPVRLVFMIGGPDHRQTEYLQILSAITMAIRDEEKRKKILTLNSKEAIMQLFNSN
jgi:PTS system nitrogen regulatory IIA component